MMSIAGAVMVLLSSLVLIWKAEQRERNRWSCDGCRTEALGSSMPYLRHTCSKDRVLYEDRRGNLYTFRERVKGPRRQPN